jgi:hypothetical protein
VGLFQKSTWIPLHDDVQQPFVTKKIDLKIKGEEEIVVNVGHDVKCVKKFWLSNGYIIYI